MMKSNTASTSSVPTCRSLYNSARPSGYLNVYLLFWHLLQGRNSSAVARAYSVWFRRSLWEFWSTVWSTLSHMAWWCASSIVHMTKLAPHVGLKGLDVQRCSRGSISMFGPPLSWAIYIIMRSPVDAFPSTARHSTRLSLWQEEPVEVPPGPIIPLLDGNVIHWTSSKIGHDFLIIPPKHHPWGASRP